MELEEVKDRLLKRLAGKDAKAVIALGELTIEVAPDLWIDAHNILCLDEHFQFEQLIDLCAVDYLAYGHSEWDVTTASSTGFSRAVQKDDPFDFQPEQKSQYDTDKRRFGVVTHLLSLKNNCRIRVRTLCENNDYPMLASLIDIWSAAEWYEREAFDLFGVLFTGHPDLRRILTDYGFIGHPFRKDFPLIGQVEMRYDELKQRVVYEPVSIEPRTLVPRTIRHDQRFTAADEVED